jgi:3-methyladenine DNA glycosylase/8-oxoguanine DNA glycosylase
LNAARLRTFTQEYFGEHGGYAQQYLFHYARRGASKSKNRNRNRSKIKNRIRMGARP